LNGMRAWLIGAEGDGIREISTVLNVSRIHNSVTAVSFMRRGLAIAKVCYCNLKLL
jgi:alkylation response protein AidB-like acyl-CoA dehydrogenase